MSPAIIDGVEQHLPNVQFTFDKFHVMKLLNEAFDRFRREKQTLHTKLKHRRSLWLKNPPSLKALQDGFLKSCLFGASRQNTSPQLSLNS